MSRFSGLFGKRNGNGNGHHVVPDDVPEAKPISVTICIPCQDEVKAMFAHDLRRLIVPAEIEVRQLFVQGTLIADSRQTLVDNAMKDEPTHLLWLDSDMRFPADTLIRLLAHNLPVVAANYVTRRPPIKPVAMMSLSPTERVDCFSLKDSTGLQQVAHVGMGVMLTETWMFREWPKPWFLVEYIEKKGHSLGEDVFFCNYCTAMNVPVYVDHDLSKEVFHIGSMEFHHAHVSAGRISSTQKVVEERNAPKVEVVPEGEATIWR